MHEFWHDYIKTKYQDNAKLCHIDTGSLDIHIKPLNFYENVGNDVEKIFDTSNCSEEDLRPLTRGMNKKVIGLFKEELVEKIMTKYFAVGQKIYSYNG